METTLMKEKSSAKSTFTMKKLFIGLTAVTMVVAMVGVVAMNKVPMKGSSEAELQEPAVTEKTTLIEEMMKDGPVLPYQTLVQTSAGAGGACTDTHDDFIFEDTTSELFG